MHLQHLRIDRFRCLNHLELEPPPGRVLVIGDNAQGKTTLLEAIFFLVTGRSFRTRSDNECIPWEAPPGASAVVRGAVRRSGGDSCRLFIAITQNSKSVRIDDQPISRLAELWGRLRAVLFNPDDLLLIKGGPGERRRYLDVALGQILPGFLFHLQRYGQVLRQRNALLKQAVRREMDGASVRSEIAPWDEQLIEHGVSILRYRFEFLGTLEPKAAELYGTIARPAPGRERVRLEYANFLKADSAPELSEARDRFGDVLNRSLDEDLRRGQTTCGPHRDDFVVRLSGKPARDFASQGQIRSLVLALRIAEVREMEERTGDSPIVLLDDLASELDPARKERVLALLDPKWQTWMTTTRREDFPPDSSFDASITLPPDEAAGS